MATRCEPDRDLEAWRAAHDVRTDLNSALLRLHLFERAYPSEAADHTATLIVAALTKLDDLEEEGAGFSAPLIGVGLRSQQRSGNG